MAGFNLFNIDIDAKQWEPIAILAGAGVAGYFLYLHLQSRGQQSQAANDFNTAEAPAQAQYQGLLQLASLQKVLAAVGLGTTAPASAATGTTSSGTTPNPGQAYYSTPASVSGGSTNTTSVGSSNEGTM